MATRAFPYVSQIRAEGRAEGLALSILQILRYRQVSVDDASRKRIMSCTNTTFLGTWLDRSIEATTVQDLFHD